MVNQISDEEICPEQVLQCEGPLTHPASVHALPSLRLYSLHHYFGCFTVSPLAQKNPIAQSRAVRIQPANQIPEWIDCHARRRESPCEPPGIVSEIFG